MSFDDEIRRTSVSFAHPGLDQEMPPTRDRERLMRLLAAEGSRRCCYAPGCMNAETWITSTCDCKYLNPARESGEQTGCCEMRAAYRILAEESSPRTLRMTKKLVKERRLELYNWMREKPEHQRLTTRQIVELSGLYNRPEYYGWVGSAIPRATRDLNALQVDGVIRRVIYSRPARWEIAYVG